MRHSPVSGAPVRSEAIGQPSLMGGGGVIQTRGADQTLGFGRASGRQVKDMGADARGQRQAEPAAPGTDTRRRAWPITGRGVRLARIPLRRDPRARAGIAASWDLDAGVAGGPAHHPDPDRLPTGPCSILDVSRGPAAAAPLHSQGRSGTRLDNRAPLASVGVARRDETGRAGRPGQAGRMAGSGRDRQTPAAAGRIAMKGSGQVKGQTRARPKG